MEEVVKHLPTKDRPPQVGDLFKIMYRDGHVDYLVIVELGALDEHDVSWTSRCLNRDGVIVNEWVFQDEIWL